MIETLTGAIAVLAFFFGWKIRKKKELSDVEKTEAEIENIEEETITKQIANLRSIIELYKSVAADLKTELQNVSNECQKLREQLKDLTHEVELLTAENANLKGEILKLQTLINTNGN